MAATLAATLLSSSRAPAQISMESVRTLDARLQQVEALYEKLPPTLQKALDGYSNVLQFAKVWHQYGYRFAESSFPARFSLLGAESAFRLAASQPAGVSRVSNPSTDLLYSSFGGFTQSETSTARCGNSVVVGFNDSGSVFETPFFFTGNGGESFSGVAVSSDGGSTFTDLGPVPPGSITGNFMGGDPVVSCSDSSTFYYSQIFGTYDTSGNPLVAVAVNKSTDGGQTWGDPVAAVSKDGNTHFLDKPWSTTDPTKPGRIYVSYTDFDYSGTNPACPGQARTAIELVGSQNGGSTWSAPRVAIQVCGDAAVQGSQLAVDSKGTLHIAWVNLGSNFPFPPRTIQISSLVPGGKLSAPVTVDSVSPGGDSYYLQGEFRDFLSMTLTVDRSGTASDGTLYVTWGDGRDKTVPDPLGIAGTYSYDDILLRVSTDGGATWGFGLPIKVNSDTQPRTAGGHDHYQPGIAVDRSGEVAVCWYDRRDDAQDFAIRHYCGESITGGLTWTNSNVGVSPFAPTHGIDLIINPIYMGDYDVVTSDFTGANSGFIGSFQVMNNSRGNPDIVAYSFP